MADMKKCPFCGSEARMVENHDWGTVHIRCADEFGTCSVLPCTEDSYHIHEVENEWNSRVTEKEIRTKAIDEFADKMIIMMPGHRLDIEQIAEQMKGNAV